MKRALALLFLLCTVASAPGARAQLGPLPVPQAPNVGGVTEGAVTDQADELGQTARGALENVRGLQIRDLLQAHRRELEADPAGHPIVRSQILALGLSDAAIAQARRQGFEVVGSDAIGDTTMTTLRAPAGMSTRRALRLLREADPQGVYDFDHLYLESGSATAPLRLKQTQRPRRRRTRAITLSTPPIVRETPRRTSPAAPMRTRGAASGDGALNADGGGSAI